MRLLFLSLLAILGMTFPNAVFASVASTPDSIICLTQNIALPVSNPLISADGNTLFFSIDHHPQNRGSINHSDIWRMELSSLNYNNYLNLGSPINNSLPNYPVGIAPFENELFVMQVENSNSYTLWKASKQGRIWQKAQRMELKWPAEYFSPKTILNYQISLDREILLFSAEEENGCGLLDIYICLWDDQNQEWGMPISLGNKLNSPFNEYHATLTADNSSIIFSSDREDGMGGYDLWISKRLNENWTEWSAPINLGSSINTNEDEIGASITASNSFLYFHRKSKTHSDIYRASISNGNTTLLNPALVTLQFEAPLNEVPEVKIQQLSPSKQLKVLQQEDEKLIMLTEESEPMLVSMSTPNTFSSSRVLYMNPPIDTMMLTQWRALLTNEPYQKNEKLIDLSHFRMML